MVCLRNSSSTADSQLGSTQMMDLTHQTLAVWDLKGATVLLAAFQNVALSCIEIVLSPLQPHLATQVMHYMIRGDATNANVLHAQKLRAQVAKVCVSK